MLSRMKTRWLAGVLVLGLSLDVSAQLEDSNAKTKGACEKYLKTPLPAEASLVAAPKAWPECNSYRLEAGIGVKQDYPAARQCAWAERRAIAADLGPRFSVASIFGGSAMLTVLYANGEGVERNIPLAIRFSCEQGWAPAEFEGRVEHLESLAEKPASPRNKFSFCDDITSGAMGGFCATYRQEIQDLANAGDLRVLSSQWPEAQQTSLRVLVEAEQAYAKAHGEGEIDLSGTARAAEEMDAEQQLRNDFLAAIKSFEKAAQPQGNARDFTNVDAALNRLYGKILANAEKHKADFGAVQPDGIRSAERKWLKYRDTWIAFARMRYQSVPAAAWLTLLTDDRIAVLKGVGCEMGIDDAACGDEEDERAPRPLP